MRWGILHANVVPDEFFQVWEIEVEVIMEDTAACDADGETPHLGSAVCDKRQGPRQILE